jgi:signal transduction histidine kinase/ligand-binding sensor domain-containing protein
MPAPLRRYFILIGLLVLAGPMPASDLGPVFRTIGVVDGLPDSRVEAVVQDRHGYVWIGTQGGLVRHEGRRLQALSHDPADPDALPGSNIMSLHAHSDGTVWAAVSGQGVVQIGPDLRRLRHLAPVEAGGILPHDNVWSMTEDCDGGLWLAFMRGGVARFDPASGQLDHIDQVEANGLAEAGFQMSIVGDAQCRIWLVQSERVSVLAWPAESVFETVIERDREAGDPIFNTIVEGSDDTMFVAQLGRLWRLPLPGPAEQVLEIPQSITGLQELPDGALLMSTYAGLLRWHPDTGQKQWTRRVDGLSDGLPVGGLLDLMIDGEGGLWLSVFRNGIVYLPPGHEAFARYQRVPGLEHGLGLDSIHALARQHDSDALWLGSRNQGIQRLDLESGQVQWLREYFDDDQLADPGVVTSLAQVGEQLLFGWASEVRAYDPARRELRRVMEREQVDQGTFSFIRADGDSALWVATFDAGLLRLSLDSGAIEHFHPEAAGNLRWPEREVNALMTDDQGGWWLAGRTGVYRFDVESGFELQAEVDGGPIQTMAWAGDDLWLATEFGLSRWRETGSDLKRVDEFAVPGRQPYGRVFAIFAGSGEDLWLVLSNGLARFRPASGQFRAFSAADGLAVAEFLRNTALQLDDGRLVIGSSRGLILVDPERVHDAPAPPPVHITALHAGDASHVIAPGPRPRIELAHQDNSFSLEYTALSYVHPSQNRFRLRLEGWDEDWVELVGHNRHYYSNLRPGRYRFQVQAASFDGQWSEKGDEVELTILKPPWSSNLALAAYGLVLVGSAGAGWRGLRLWRRRRRDMQEAQQKRAMAEQQRRLIERLNRNLEPVPLARVIAAELRQVTGGVAALFRYRHEQLPDEVITVGAQPDELDREQWETLTASADPSELLRISLCVEGQAIADCLVRAGSGGFEPDHQERLELLVEMVGQALHNLLLIEKVRALAGRAEQASAAKSEFLATMSHEIRTPLHGVMGMVELLQETESNPAQQDLLDTLRQSGLQLQRIIDDVLDISRIEAGRISLDRRPFELVPLLEQVAELHAVNAGRKQLDLRLRIASDLPLLAIGDADRLFQVVGNLLSNAVKFTETGGIEVVAECPQAGILQLTVCDSGTGISVEDRERLFEPFVQLDASITRSHSGSGLGLAICRRLVSAMDGELSLLEHPGKGCRFRVSLPIAGPVPDQRPMTGLLGGLIVASWLQGSDQRVLTRLSRRWGFELVNGRRTPVRACDVLIFDPGLITDQDRLADWQTRAGRLIELRSNHNMGSAEQGTCPGQVQLRRPLLEGRLIGLLMDRILTLEQRKGGE